MKNIALAVISVAFLAQSVNASELTTRIMDVQPTKAGKETLVFEEGGRVIRVKTTERKLLNALMEARTSNLRVRMDINSATHALQGAQLLNESFSQALQPDPSEMAPFTPTEMSISEAIALFNKMDGQTKSNSQCFNRAHGWAYDMWNNNQVNSMKIFIFFTRKYIEQYNHGWWFHVAPYVVVRNQNGTQERVMDRTFNDGPTTVKDWTDDFMKNKVTCPVVEKFSDFHEKQYAQYCYLMKANMYYRSPDDMKKLETENRQELEWNLKELREARKQAFVKWRKYEI